MKIVSFTALTSVALTLTAAVFYQAPCAMGALVAGARGRGEEMFLLQDDANGGGEEERSMIVNLQAVPHADGGGELIENDVREQLTCSDDVKDLSGNYQATGSLCSACSGLCDLYDDEAESRMESTLRSLCGSASCTVLFSTFLSGPDCSGSSGDITCRGRCKHTLSCNI